MGSMLTGTSAGRRRHVTIVHGQNGTGKSAIMQALQVCLGASARDTGAAASIKNFIKTGKLCAVCAPTPVQSNLVTCRCCITASACQTHLSSRYDPFCRCSLACSALGTDHHTQMLGQHPLSDRNYKHRDHWDYADNGHEVKDDFGPRRDNTKPFMPLHKE